MPPEAQCWRRGAGGLAPHAGAVAGSAGGLASMTGERPPAGGGHAAKEGGYCNFFRADASGVLVCNQVNVTWQLRDVSEGMGGFVRPVAVPQKKCSSLTWISIARSACLVRTRLASLCRAVAPRPWRSCPTSDTSRAMRPCAATPPLLESVADRCPRRLPAQALATCCSSAAPRRRTACWLGRTRPSAAASSTSTRRSRWRCPLTITSCPTSPAKLPVCES